MKVRYKDSLEYKAIQRLHRMRSNIVLRKDFDMLNGSQSQITRVLNKLIDDKKLIKIGFGIYAKAYLSKFTDIPLIEGGVNTAFDNALKKLGVSFEPGSAEKEYIAGLTTQIPARKIVRLKSRCRRRISYGKANLSFEKNINAK